MDLEDVVICASGPASARVDTVGVSARINVSQETIRNWEQGKRCPTGAAEALLKILDKAPEAALRALS